MHFAAFFIIYWAKTFFAKHFKERHTCLNNAVYSTCNTACIHALTSNAAQGNACNLSMKGYHCSSTQWIVSSPVLLCMLNKSNTQEEHQWIAAQTPLLALTIPGHSKIIYGRFIISSSPHNNKPNILAKNISRDNAQAYFCQLQTRTITTLHSQNRFRFRGVQS